MFLNDYITTDEAENALSYTPFLKNVMLGNSSKSTINVNDPSSVVCQVKALEASAVSTLSTVCSK